MSPRLAGGETLAAVTGGTGFVGGHLVKELRARGYGVRCLVRQSAPAAALARLGCRVVAGSLEDETALAALVAGVDVVFHVAGAVAARDEAAFMRVNHEGTLRVALACHAAGVRRLVYVSSLAVTGPSPPGRPADESQPPNPVTRYGRSKRAGEDAVAGSGASFTIVRPPGVYGPGDRELLRVFRAARLGVVPILGDGRQELSWVHVADLARALADLAASPRTAGRTYHAAHHAIVTQRELVVAVGRAVGRDCRCLQLSAPAVRALLWLTQTAARLAGRVTILNVDKAAEFLAPAWTCDSTAIERDIGWRASIVLAQGLATTAESYRARGWL